VRRTGALAVEAVLLLVAIVLAAPPVRRGDDAVEPDGGTPDAAEPAPADAASGHVVVVMAS
jgi:hypothetical protein